MNIQTIRNQWKLRTLINALTIIIYLIAIKVMLSDHFNLFIIIVLIAIIIEIVNVSIKKKIMSNILKYAQENDLPTNNIKKKSFKGFSGDDKFLNLMRSKNNDDFLITLKDILNK